MIRACKCALLAAALFACGKGAAHAPDAGPDGGAACDARGIPKSSDGAPKRFATPQALPLPSGSTFASSPIATQVGADTVVLFPSERGVAAAIGRGPAIGGSFSLADQADSPALAARGSRIFAGFRKGGALTVGISDGAQGLAQLGAGHGRTVQVPLPAGASAPGQLDLVATPGNELVAGFTVTIPGGRSAIYVARMRDAACATCTLSFDAPIAAGPQTPQTRNEEFPKLAAGPGGALAVAFIRPDAREPAAQVWISQGTLGAALSLRPLLVDEQAAEEPATPAYFGDGSLALVYGRLRGIALADGGMSQSAAQVADVVARHLDRGQLGTPALVNDDDPNAVSTHWLPGAAVDIYDRLWVAFYDTRFASPADAAWGPGAAGAADPAQEGACTAVVELARSEDKGATFKPNSLVTADGTTVPFDPVPASIRRPRAPLGPVTVTATGSELLVGHTDAAGVLGRAMLAEGGLP